MKDFKSKVEAETNKVAGAAKQTVGKAVGNSDLEAKGDLQRAKGNVQGVVNDVKNTVKSIVK